jgi:hypothetical protein
MVDKFARSQTFSAQFRTIVTFIIFRSSQLHPELLHRMKKPIISAIIATVMVSSLQARTWTSAEGSKTFKGDYVSHTAEYVTVTKGFNKVRFKIAMLSEDDKKWLDEKKAEALNSQKLKAVEEVGFGALGDKLKGNIVKLTDKKYANFELQQAPEYYIIYFTASW